MMMGGGQYHLPKLMTLTAMMLAVIRQVTKWPL